MAFESILSKIEQCVIMPSFRYKEIFNLSALKIEDKKYKCLAAVLTTRPSLYQESKYALVFKFS